MKSVSKFILFAKSDYFPGILLFLATILALVAANSNLEQYYKLLLDTSVQVHISSFTIAKPLLLWINDGLMAIFFFLIGLELKREILEGELSNLNNIKLPIIGAIGGMIVPAAVYAYFNFNDKVAIQGWAIPAATDIAFALGVLALLGSRVPVSVKVFLTSLAIFDDLGAIIIIAVFYTSNISAYALVVAGLCIASLFIINRLNVTAKGIYILIGIIMWVATLKSGVHATLSGVILAFFIPMKERSSSYLSPLKTLEHSLHPYVSFLIIPVFAFANAGINFSGISLSDLTHDVPLGIGLGLLIGKQIGIFGFCWLFIKLKLAALPANMSMLTLYGTAALCGIGFTMSLFIGSLAFEETGVDLLFDERLGIIIGSFLSGIIGYSILRVSLNKQ